MFPQSRVEDMSPMQLEMLARGEHDVSGTPPYLPSIRLALIPAQHDTVVVTCYIVVSISHPLTRQFHSLHAAIAPECKPQPA